MKKEITKPVATMIRELEVGQYVDLPRVNVGAINSAIYYQTSSLSRKFSRILKEDKITYRVTRLQ